MAGNPHAAHRPGNPQRALGLGGAGDEPKLLLQGFDQTLLPVRHVLRRRRLFGLAALRAARLRVAAAAKVGVGRRQPGISAGAAVSGQRRGGAGERGAVELVEAAVKGGELAFLVYVKTDLGDASTAHLILLPRRPPRPPALAGRPP